MELAGHLLLALARVKLKSKERRKHNETVRILSLWPGVAQMHFEILSWSFPPFSTKYLKWEERGVEGKMTPGAMALAPKTDNLSTMARTHMVEGERQSLQLSLNLHIHVYTHTLKI